MLFEQFRRALPSEICVFVYQRNVYSATEMVKLADLFYECNKDCNLKVDAKRNFNSRGNQYLKSIFFDAAR